MIANPVDGVFSWAPQTLKSSIVSYTPIEVATVAASDLSHDNGFWRYRWDLNPSSSPGAWGKRIEIPGNSAFWDGQNHRQSAIVTHTCGQSGGKHSTFILTVGKSHIASVEPWIC